jgi:hypothetical protein
MKDVLVFCRACAIFVPPLFPLAEEGGKKKHDKRTNGIFIDYPSDIKH